MSAVSWGAGALPGCYFCLSPLSVFMHVFPSDGWDLSSPTNQESNLGPLQWSLNHWTARKSQNLCLYEGI